MPKMRESLFPVVLATALCGTTVAAEEGRITIEEALEERGWSVQLTADGDLQLSVPTQEMASPALTEPETPPAPTQDNHLQALGTQLEASGWKVLRKADGSLSLHPPETAKAEIATTPDQAPAESPSDAQWKQMQQQLEAAGWGASREADGTLVLIPPEEPLKETSPVEEASAPEQQDYSMGTIQEKLKESGWQVTQHNDGSILLYPPDLRESEELSIQPCRGHAPPDGFNLPANSWSRARKLAMEWLKEQTPGKLKVGKIREIFDVFLVSIVTASRPHRLRHQIVVRKRDGRIIVLN